MYRYSMKPFKLEQPQIEWVEKTLASMTLEEKLHQLFMDMAPFGPSSEAAAYAKKYQPAGFRYGNRPPDELRDLVEKIQGQLKIPGLIAANIEAGGNGGVSGGTHLGDPVAIGSTYDEKYAYQMAYYGCKEAAAVGCNWTFAPVVDILFNWRNCVVPNRSFGSDPDLVLRMAKAYHRGARDAGLACAMKHFPGDGCDERDQHLCMTINDLSCEEWDKSFGKVYSGMIEDGIEAVMIGHIALPSYSRKLRPGIRDEDIMPASVAPELVTGLLREKLGFNGLIITDATHMVGLTSRMRRSEYLPAVIIAGCDLILFSRKKEEDIGFMRDAVTDGRLSAERIDEAVGRILAFKAMLRLPEKQAEGKLIPPKENLAVIGCAEHKSAAHDVYERSITLIKNTRNQLPIRPETHPRIMLYCVDSIDSRMGTRNIESLQDMMKQALEKRGFKVGILDVPTGGNADFGKQMLSQIGIKEFRDSCDAVILAVSVGGASGSNERRIHWRISMGPEIPWYVPEKPSVMISFTNPFHLIDVPAIPTAINAYTRSQEVADIVVDKLMGEKPFTGISPVDAFCGAWDTRL